MTQKKVYITGMGLISSLGNDVETVFRNLKENVSGVRSMPEWQKYKGLNTNLMAPAMNYDISCIPRKKRRSMSPMAEMGAIATLRAMKQAGLDEENPWKDINPQKSVMIMGSTTGSPGALESHFQKLFENEGPEGQTSTAFFKIMNHSVPANVALATGFQGPLLSTGSACSTSSQAMIQAWEMIQSELYDFAIVGGADEAFYTSAAIFDTVQAASTKYNDDPNSSPRPFDINRDGLVISEGAGVVIMESEESINKRNAKPIAEFSGGAYCCDGQHMSQPIPESMAYTMNWALNRAGVNHLDIEYINAHATATVLGDRQEAQAIATVFGKRPPVSSLKGHFGHSLAACGTIEAICSIEMMKADLMIANRNLVTIDPECESIFTLQHNKEGRFNTILSNNFAFGGMNTSFVLKNCE